MGLIKDLTKKGSNFDLDNMKKQCGQRASIFDDESPGDFGVRVPSFSEMWHVTNQTENECGTLKMSATTVEM
jgi:hypothetical protein